MGTDSIRRISRLDSAPVKQEAHRVASFSLTIAKRVHELLELGRPLDLEEDFVVVVGDFDVEMFWLTGLAFALGGCGRTAGVRHCVCLLGCGCVGWVGVNVWVV